MFDENEIDHIRREEIKAPAKPELPPPTVPEVIEPEERYIVEIMPTFNGGSPSTEFYKYINANLRYPDQAAQNNVSGRVIVTFVFSISFVLY